MRRKIIRIYGILFVVGLLYWLWIQLTGLKLPCFYLVSTGFRCPGCGSTRMFLALLNLDFVAAFSYNPVVFVLFFLWNGVALLGFTEKVKFVRNPQFLWSLFSLSIVSLFLFGLYRIFS